MNIDAFAAAPVVIQVHALAAMGALAVGLGIYALPKGQLKHRIMGMTCAVLLLVTVGTAFFIRTSEAGTMSWIHGFIPLTLFGLLGVGMGVWRGNFIRHKHAARGVIFGALLVPGLFTLMPGRLLHRVAFGG